MTYHPPHPARRERQALASPFFELAPTPVQETSLDFAHALDGFRASEPKLAPRMTPSRPLPPSTGRPRSTLPAPASQCRPESDKARDHADRLLRETEAAQVVAEEKLAAFVDALAAHRDEIDEAVLHVRMKMGARPSAGSHRTRHRLRSASVPPGSPPSRTALADAAP